MITADSGVDKGAKLEEKLKILGAMMMALIRKRKRATNVNIRRILQSGILHAFE